MKQRTYTIGELARRSGLSTRRIRFYADAGLLAPDRTEARYRLFDDRDLVVLDIVRTLREAGAGLEAIRTVLERDSTLAELLALRLTEVEASLKRQKALAATLRLALASDAPSVHDLRRIAEMIGHSQTQRHATATAFLDTLTRDLRFDPRWRDLMHDLIAAPDLPDEPSSKQIDAWLELNEMLADPGLQRLLRAQATDTGRTVEFLRVRDEGEAWRAREDEIMAQARSALRRNISSASAEAQRLADVHIAFMAWNRGLADDAPFRDSIREIWVDRDVLERFWERIAVLNGRKHNTTAEYEWLAQATALRLAGG